MPGAPVKVLANVSWPDVAYDCLRIRALKATVRRDLVVGSEIRSCQHKERLEALHAEIGIIRLKYAKFP